MQPPAWSRLLTECAGLDGAKFLDKFCTLLVQGRRESPEISKKSVGDG